MRADIADQTQQLMCLNFEMAATAEMIAIAIQTRPNAACIVPENRDEITTEGGLAVIGRESVG